LKLDGVLVAYEGNYTIYYMRLHRFHIEGTDLAEKKPAERIILQNKGIIHQWKSVFRYTVGGRVQIFDDSKLEYLAIIEEISEYKAVLVLLELVPQVGVGSKKTKKVLKNKSAGPFQEKNTRIIPLEKEIDGKNSIKQGLWLIQSMLKGEHFDQIVEKTTELGVDCIVPVISDRTIKKGVNLERARKIAIEASEQSGRVSVPCIEPLVVYKVVSCFNRYCKGKR
jgi:16S rRNA U1498 N3-methylase RsmE